jgi:hypothetical protein
MIVNRFSIKTLLGRKQNPELFKGHSACIYLIHVSQLVKGYSVKSYSIDESSYSDSYFKCTKLDKRITKKHCTGCKMYLKPNAIESKTA